MSDTCGKMSHGVFMLDGAFGPGIVRRCAVPSGVPLLASPAGIVQWKSGDVDTRAELQASVTEGLTHVSDVKASLDGSRLRNVLVRGYVRRMSLQPGNFVQTVDPTVTGRKVPIATAAWLDWVGPLSPGRHVVRLSDKIDGNLFSITFCLHVH